MDMNVIEIPDLGTPAVIVAAAPAASHEKVMGVCLPVQQTQDKVLGVLTTSPDSDAVVYLSRYFKLEVASISFENIRITKQPTYGQLSREKDAGGIDRYVYRPNFGYLGKDRFEAVVLVGNETVRIVYYIVVQPNRTDQEGFRSEKYCPKLDWKISLPSTSRDVASLQPFLDAALLTTARQTLAFADLTGSALGQITGTGASAKISP